VKVMPARNIVSEEEQYSNAKEQDVDQKRRR
jgi:hypothetical protein